jgi:hypothetical protein
VLASLVPTFSSDSNNVNVIPPGGKKNEQKYKERSAFPEFWTVAKMKDV